MKLDTHIGESGVVDSAKEVAGGVKDLVVNPLYTAGHAALTAPIETVKGTFSAVLEEGVLGTVAQTVEGTKEIIMGPGELILGVRDGVWRALIMDGIVNNIFKTSTLNPLNWPKVLKKLGGNLFLNMPKEVIVGALKGTKRLLWNAPKHLVWGIPTSLLRGLSGTVESVLGGAAILIGGGSDKGLSGVLVETRDALNRITKGLVPKTTIIPIGGGSASAEPVHMEAPVAEAPHAAMVPAAAH
ncbi:MAG: hypothetical protein WC843_05280 [Candidatus Gracilibacteria bacterium]|jgi:hypothetical protein